MEIKLRRKEGRITETAAAVFQTQQSLLRTAFLFLLQFIFIFSLSVFCHPVFFHLFCLFLEMFNADQAFSTCPVSGKHSLQRFLTEQVIEMLFLVINYILYGLSRGHIISFEDFSSGIWSEPSHCRGCTAVSFIRPLMPLSGSVTFNRRCELNADRKCRSKKGQNIGANSKKLCHRESFTAEKSLVSLCIQQKDEAITQDQFVLCVAGACCSFLRCQK